MPQSGDSAVEEVDVEGIKAYLAQSAVEFALLFGSRATDTASDTSDVDIALRFPAAMDKQNRFHYRNRIDADLQTYAAGFVDVSDIESLPTHVAHAAVRDGLLLAGDEQSLEEYREKVQMEYERTEDERKQERREFIDRLARGDT
jgi:predicted nucleotidyltransferase